MKSLLSIFLLAMASWFIRPVFCQQISVKASHVCSKTDNNRLKFLMHLYLESGIAVGLKALDANEAEINTCNVDGQGTATSPYNVESYIDLVTNIETNPCGMMMVQNNGESFYTWKVRVDTGTNRRGAIIGANCSRDTITNGEVETLVKFNISTLSVVPRFAENITGMSTYATGSDLTVRAVVYPNGLQTPTALKSANGFYLFNCYSGTNEAVTQNRERFIDNDGCPVEGTALRPSNSPRTIDTSGGSPFVVEASYFAAATIARRTNVFVTCQIGICTVDSDPSCDDRCAAVRNNAQTSGVVSGVQFKTSFIVQDIPAQQLYATTSANGPLLDFVNADTPILLVSKFSPTGLLDSNQASINSIRAAKGYFVYGCTYAENANFVNSVLFIDGLGCPVAGTKLTPSDGFELQSAENNVFTLQSGTVNVVQISRYTRFWVRCNTGICTEPSHSYCSKRCGADTNNIGATSQLGYTGLTFSLSVLNTTNQPAISIDIGNSDGRNVGNNMSVLVNTPLSFSVTVVPGGTDGGAGNTFANAKGIFVANCYTSTVPNPTEDEKDYLIDSNGCRVPSSPYSTTQNCMMDNTFSGVPPFTLDCGTFTPPQVGTLYTNCSLIAVCLDENNRYCRDRCSQGATIDDSNVVELGTSFSRVTQVVALDLDRTAILDIVMISNRCGEFQNFVALTFLLPVWFSAVVQYTLTAVLCFLSSSSQNRSNEIVTQVIGVTVAVPIVVLCITAVVVYCIVNSQRPK